MEVSVNSHMALNSSGLTWNITDHTKQRAAMPSLRKGFAAMAADAILFIKVKTNKWTVPKNGH